MFELATDTVLLLMVASFAAGFIDSIAGGGGLITVPALLLAGLSPIDALGTNKLGGMFGSGSATIAYASKGHVDLKAQLPSAALAAIGGGLGALLATIVPGEWMRAALPVLLVAIALYFAFKPNMDDVDRAQRMSPALFGFTLVPAIGLYDGLFGPGHGLVLHARLRVAARLRRAEGDRPHQAAEFRLEHRQFCRLRHCRSGGLESRPADGRDAIPRRAARREPGHACRREADQAAARAGLCRAGDPA